MSLRPDSRLVLNPELCLRNDVDRAVIITRPPPLANRSYVCRLVHPAPAFILSLLDGRRTIRELGVLWSSLTGKPLKAAAREVASVLHFYDSGERREDKILVSARDPLAKQARTYDPRRFVIPVDTANLRDRRLRIPYTVHYVPTLFCPHRCVYCYAKRSAAEASPLSLGRFGEILDELKGLGVESIQLSGGEVFARPDSFELLESIVGRGLKADVPTKMKLGPEMISRLRHLGIDLIQFSIDSSSPRIIDRMVGVKGYHRSAFESLNNLRQGGMSVRVNCVLTPINMPGVGPLLDLLGGLGNVRRVALTPYGRSMFHHQDRLFVSASALRKVEELVSRKARLYPHMEIRVGGSGDPRPADPREQRRKWEGRAFCTANRDGFVVLPDGRVTVCEELYDHPAFIIGDLRTQSVMEMWNSAKAHALIWPRQEAVPEGPCRTCAEFVECNAVRGRCWRDILKSYGWGRPYYPDPRCALAPAGNRLG